MDIDDYTDVGHHNLEQFITKEYSTLPLLTRAEQFYSYSNPNYLYAGALIEHFSQQEFATYIQNNVFEPVGMSSTTG